MALEARLALRQTQRLVMTPMLQQAIQLLQLLTIELQEVLQKELTENPVLEEEPPDEGPTAEQTAASASADSPPPDAPATAEPADAPELPFDITEIMFGPPEERSLVSQEEHEESRFENFITTTPTLADHLEEQLRLTAVEPHLAAIAREIIGNIDEDGYLSPLVMFEKALVRVQSCEPPGVGARDIEECLLLQLRRGSDPDPLTARIIEDCPGVLRGHSELWEGGAADERRRDQMVDAIRAVLYPPGAPERTRAEPDRASRHSWSDPSTAAPRDRERAEGGTRREERREERERRREPDRQRLVAAVDRLLTLKPRPGRACATREALARRLGAQLDEEALLPEVRLAADAVVASLDADGYLRMPLAEVADKTPLPGFDRALALVQTFDPIGIGARGLRECLLIQLRGQATPDGVAAEILENHFESLQRCRYAEIARALRQEVSRVEEAVEAIATLEPKPGRRFAAIETRYVVPDVYVQKIDGEYKVVLNDEGIPRLRINSYYRTLLARSPGDDGRRYVEDKVRSAMWLIKSVHQRQRTLYRVTDSIVRFQKEFLDHGLPHLRPLSLRDVADDIRMHESTVSRVTTSKYVQTPQGLYELKFFFHSGIATGEGDVVSSLSVKKTIRDLVAGESPQKPLSDQEVTLSLRQGGLNIARRTVAKYREELGILPSHQRRQATRRRGQTP